jgi:hypothetical protein
MSQTLFTGPIFMTLHIFIQIALIAGSVDGSFDRNFAVMLDFQFKKSF